MKFIKHLALPFISILFIAGCASTKSESASDNAQPEEELDSSKATSSTSLMDLYISGEIPGYIE